MLKFSKADDLFFRIAGYCGGGPLWEANSYSPLPRACFYLWRSNAGIWHAFVQRGPGFSAFEHVAESKTRDAAFDAAMRAA